MARHSSTVRTVSSADLELDPPISVLEVDPRSSEFLSRSVWVSFSSTWTSDLPPTSIQSSPPKPCRGNILEPEVVSPPVLLPTPSPANLCLIELSISASLKLLLGMMTSLSSKRSCLAISCRSSKKMNFTARAMRRMRITTLSALTDSQFIRYPRRSGCASVLLRFVSRIPGLTVATDSSIDSSASSFRNGQRLK